MDIDDFLKCNKLNISKDKIQNIKKNKIGILITNLGSPTKPTYWSIYKYLSKFLGDTRVVKLNRFIWLPVLHSYVLPFYVGASLLKYKKIWTNEGSPLSVNTYKQCLALKTRLYEKYNDKITISYGLRYGGQTIDEGLNNLKEKDINKLLVIPLYPQSAECTVASALDGLSDSLKSWNNIPELRFLSGYCFNDMYIYTMTESILNFWKNHGKCNKLIISYHSLPTKSVQNGDMYPFYCIESTQKLVNKLELKKNEYIVAFQSNLEGQEWLKPFLEDVLKQLSSTNKDEIIDIICPSFSSDCLETLEEVEINYKTMFQQHGGGKLRYINCLNYSKMGIDLLMNIIEQNIVGW
ncbi:ferrochelatase, putative [Hepatocystis sp. ex Piliocolobus tephrosceles]|nr:ferrochelatase, putative [Hepatocystis sp. ex Piliocolobus tephrosceles]